MGDLRCTPKKCFKREHLPLSELKEIYKEDHAYLSKSNIPLYPESVLFRISRVCHVTGKSGFRGIIEDGGFQKPAQDKTEDKTEDNFLWWSLSVTKSEIASAEKRFLRWKSKDADYNQSPFLEKFTTSPAFQSESRYGNFRFTFPFRKLLREYAQRFCKDSAPVLRVLCTELYRQQILYTVLVHPRHVQKYGQYPRLPLYDKGICGYRRGRMFWFCQSPSDCYRNQLNMDEENMWAEPLSSQEQEYYVWDHVAVVFHMEPDWKLAMERKWLLKNVTLCEIAEPCRRRPEDQLTKKDAEEVLEELKRKHL
ncbi:uncharacterized protein LOC113577919 [Electrophorus electricus]|uniref:uncharacterized protein LOC113577919 n=1 Tax=Electrophorus electricus TaxID=8005 RepID=UPI0015CFC2F9|nr:uncharacterized protein LOC113577919 [Electrophorus electricus]